MKCPFISKTVSGPFSARLTRPALIAAAGECAEKRFSEFLTAQIRNPNTKRAYGRAFADFCIWSDRCAISIPQIEPITVAAYVETINHCLSPPSASCSTGWWQDKSCP
jgi:hypothetical protein